MSTCMATGSEPSKPWRCRSSRCRRRTWRSCCGCATLRPKFRCFSVAAVTGGSTRGLAPGNALSRRWTEAPDADSYHGREGAGRYFERDFNEVWSEWRFRPQEFVDGPEGVLVAVANSGLSRSGIEVNMPIFQTFRLRDGMVVHTKASSMATGAQSRGTKRVGSVAENMETT